MRANKITRWIDVRKRAATVIIASEYYRSKESGKRLPILKPVFLLAVLQRFVYVLISLFRFNRKLFIPYRRLSFYRFWRRLIGISRFEVPDLLPEPASFKPFSLPVRENPEVSIVICVHNHIGFTYNCLQSILANTQGVSYEVLVVDDYSTDGTGKVLSQVEHLRVIENEANIGFLKSCNKALQHCRGTYVCFLNNDVQVLPGWLSHLIAPFHQVDGVGLVGAKLIYPYGLLQEAGGIVNYKGEPANYGKFGDPQGIFFNYLRETDYCSGACLLAKRTDLTILEGFDETFAPAYYEDTDLAFRMRYVLNKKVYYQPLSKVVHFEGVSSGKVATSGNVKRYQTVNAEKFEKRWRHVFETFPPTANHTLVARKFIKGKTILIIEPLLPTFDQDSGSRRMFELIKLLLKLNWNVIFSPEANTQEEPYYSTLVNMGVWILNKPVFHKSSKYLIRPVISIVDVAWVSRPHMNRRYGRFLKKNGIRWINDAVDLHFLREERELEITGKDSKKLRKVKRRKKRELSLFRASDTVIAITDTEAEVLNGYGINNVQVVPNIHRPVDEPLPGFADRQGICFIGGYRHQPNVDAAVWLVEEIMPVVWEELPGLPVYLLGSLPPRRVIDLQSDLVHVPGYVADVSDYFLSSRIFVAPLRYGAGMKGKIGQSLEFRLPVITTDIGAEGMGLTDRVHYLRANTTGEFVHAILELNRNSELWSVLSKGAAEALSPYSPQRIRETLAEVVGQGR